MDDRELQTQFAKQGSDAAFRALVERYLPLVYSAGVRQVRSPDLAKDVSQEVFLDLARRLRRGPPLDPLAPWLLVVTRRRAVDLIRSESRRRRREEKAGVDAAHSRQANWEAIAPLIDQALVGLGNGDRDAVVRRFFQQQSYAEMAAAYGGTEASVQKRVSRALQRLRTALARLGVTAGTLFETELFGHSVQAAPAGLAQAVAGYAGVHFGLESGAAFSWIHRLNHSVAVHIAAGSVALSTFGFGWHELRVAQGEETQAAIYAAQVASNRNQAEQLLKGQSARIRERAEQSALDAQADALAADTRSLKDWFARTPSLRLPEFDSLTEQTWIEFAYAHPGIAHSNDPSAAGFAFRSQVRGQTEQLIRKGLQAFGRAQMGALTHMAQLVPFLGGMSGSVMAEFSVMDGRRLPFGPPRPGPVVISRPLVVSLDPGLAYGGREAWEVITGEGISYATMPAGSAKAP